jgi:hypothetical protein
MERCLFSKITTTMQQVANRCRGSFGLVAARTFGSLVQAGCRIGYLGQLFHFEPVRAKRQLATADPA